MSEQAKPKPAGEEDVAWRSFPQFEKVLGPEGMGTLMEKIEKTCRRLDDLTRNGAPQEQSRARAAMTAYGRTMDLLRRLNELRDQMAAQGPK